MPKCTYRMRFVYTLRSSLILLQFSTEMCTNTHNSEKNNQKLLFGLLVVLLNLIDTKNRLFEKPENDLNNRELLDHNKMYRNKLKTIIKK